MDYEAGDSLDSLPAAARSVPLPSPKGVLTIPAFNSKSTYSVPGICPSPPPPPQVSTDNGRRKRKVLRSGGPTADSWHSQGVRSALLEPCAAAGTRVGLLMAGRPGGRSRCPKCMGLPIWQVFQLKRTRGTPSTHEYDLPRPGSRPAVPEIGKSFSVKEICQLYI